MNTVIKDGTIVTADRTYKGDILVEDGKIAKIGTGLSGNETLDATGCYVVPGGIDPHTCLLYTSPSPRDATLSRMPSSA